MESRRESAFDQDQAFRSIIAKTLGELASARVEAPEQPVRIAMPGGMVEANPNTAAGIINDLRATWGERFPDLFTDFSE